MRLHRLTLRDVKGVRERTVDFPDRGVLVIEGPNEIGKTTLLDGFDALLMLKATSKAAAVRALAPVDRDVAPFVEAELTIGGQRVRYAKRWLRTPSTTLDILGARPEHLTGDAAQQRLDAMVEQHLDRTLWDALRLTQTGDGSVAPLVSSAVLTAALDTAAGAQQHADGADALLDKVAAEVALYFTATGRATGVYREALTRHTEAQDAVAEAHRRLEEGAALLERLGQARERAAATDSEVGQAAERLAAAERVAGQTEAVATAHEVALERLAHAQDRQRLTRRALRQREALVAEREECSRELQQARHGNRADLEAAEEQAQALLMAEAAAEAAATKVEEAADDVAAARADADHLAAVRELEVRRDVLDRAEELIKAVCAARGVVAAQEGSGGPPVGGELARRVRALQDRLDAMTLQHDGATPSVEVEAWDSVVEVDTGDQTAVNSVRPGERVRVQASHDTTVEVPGHARIRVRLHEEARHRVAEIDRLRVELRHTLTELNCADVDEVDALVETAEAARTRLREATRDVEALLRPWGSTVTAEAVAGVLPRRLVEEVEQARSRVAHGLAARRAGRELPVDDARARVAVRVAEGALRDARERHQRARDALARRRADVATLTTRLDRAEGHIAAQQDRVRALQTQLVAAREDASDEVLAEQVGRCAAEVGDWTRAVHEAAEAMAAANVEGARAELRSARHQHTLASRAREDAHAELNQIKGQVEMAAGEGRQELYDLAVAHLDDAERDLRAIDRRARAARHLHATLNRHRDNAHRAYVRPYTHALEELGRQVYGSGFAVTVDEDLSLSARTLGGVTVPFAELSGGAKEQLGILARLAVARLVDPTQGVPVVIDDALGYSDPQRLQQMGAVLGSATEGSADMQVILLTCTPERYATIPDVHTVRLTA
ncbi:AAA family ATPase [Ornithinimicrobium pratense]|uniref:AAA family ATPase n=1 Tax=Ornithinimicrobium pratense TaxID=2593973 RepID=A0A5J6V1L4_9MICO|nr:AAA family ATPase [Ornithinimicrobium pratense]QFG67679.1 AAA family ATPase [Ornithinimicrobium pratense]